MASRNSLLYAQGAAALGLGLASSLLVAMRLGPVAAGAWGWATVAVVATGVTAAHWLFPLLSWLPALFATCRITPTTPSAGAP